jgi:hypothetical protein
MAFTLPADVPIRIISYLTGSDEPYVIGGVPWLISGMLQGYNVVLRPLSQARNATTLFRIEPHGAEGFRLKWDGAPFYLAWIVPGGRLLMKSDPAYLTKDHSYFTVDSVKDGNWFALNNCNHSAVVDVDHGNTADNTFILSRTWNGGDNQVWRFEQASS